MSAVPFDPPMGDAVAECIRLATLEQLGQEHARRCAQQLDIAEAAWRRARDEQDLVVAATAAEMAADAARWCGRLASACAAILGNADIDTVKRCWEQAARANAVSGYAREVWTRLKDERGAAHA